MEFKTVKFTQELSINGLSCWPSLEMDMQPDEDPQEAFTKIIAEIQKLNTTLLKTPAVEPEPIIQVEKKNPSQLEKLIEAIRGSSDLKVLDSFKILIKGKPEAEAAYSETEKKLINDATR
jgi:hypothetical protein